MNFDFLQFFAAFFALIKIVSALVGTITLIVSLFDGDEKRKAKELFWGLLFLGVGVLVPVLVGKIAGSRAQKLAQVLGEWDPSYFVDMFK